jgi:[acyl-carrier-protein] S-malonyltransferase
MSLAILCSGQGAQHAGMAELLSGNQDAAKVLDQGAVALGEDPRRWLGEPDALFRNAVAQPLICLVAFASWTALQHALPLPVAVAGYSVGELASYACAGALDAAELARLAATRARSMDGAADRPGGLIALQGLRRDAMVALCTGHGASLAIVIGDDRFVVGGYSDVLAALAADAERQGIRVTSLKVGIAAHTPLLAAAVVPFRKALENSALRAPAIPAVAGVDASLVTRRETAIATLSAQVAKTIEWARCLDALYEHGARVFLELGPGAALSRMAQLRFGNQVAARSLDDFRSLSGAIAWTHRVLG